MTPEDLAALQRAVWSLEHPGLAARLTNMVGKPIELIGDALPTSARRAIATATSKALQAALKVALRTMPRTDHAGSGLLHKALATASGAAGGAFGLATLPVELPVSTIVMLRSIAEIARSHGEDLSDPESALSCIQVFALGGPAASTDASESVYFAVRAILAKSVTEAARFIAERGVVEESAPVLVRYMRRFVLGWKRRGLEARLGAKIVVYADDLVICCRGNAEEAMSEMRRLMMQLKLTVNEAKTDIRRLPQERFAFLGYDFGRYYSSKTGRAYLRPQPSKASVKRVIGEIRHATAWNILWLSAEEMVTGLNRLLVGWANSNTNACASAAISNCPSDWRAIARTLGSRAT